MTAEQLAGRSTDEGLVSVKLEEVWAASGPQDHPYNEFYRREADRLLTDAILRVRASSGKPLDVDWEVPLQHGVVSIRPDHVTLIEGPRGAALGVQRWRTGKPPKKADSDDVYALYARGAELARPGAQVTVETLYLSTNEVISWPSSSKSIAAGLENYDEALVGILRGEFAPNPKDWMCPRCPHYFICPASAFCFVPAGEKSS